MDSCKEMRSAPDALNRSENSKSCFVLRASRASLEKIRPVMRPLRMSSSIRLVSGCDITSLPLTPASRYTSRMFQSRDSA